MRLINNPISFPIQPSHNVTDVRLSRPFKNKSLRQKAFLIVAIFRERGESWKSFLLREFDAAYRKMGYKRRFVFGELLTKGYVVLKDGELHITEEFVYECRGLKPE